MIPKFIDTWADVAGEYTEFRAEFDYQPAEPDTRTDASVTVTAAYYWDNRLIDVLDSMTPAEKAELEERLLFEVAEIVRNRRECA